VSRQLVRLEIGDEIEYQGNRFVFSGMIGNTGRPKRVIFAPIPDPATDVSPDVLNIIKDYVEGDDSSSRIIARKNGTLKQVREILEGQGLDGVAAETIIASIIESGLRFRQKGY
jgi:hypothetical protein